METPTPTPPPKPFAGVAPRRRYSTLPAIGILMLMVAAPHLVFETHTANKVGAAILFIGLFAARLNAGPLRGGRR